MAITYLVALFPSGSHYRADQLMVAKVVITLPVRPDLQFDIIH